MPPKSETELKISSIESLDKMSNHRVVNILEIFKQLIKHWNNNKYQKLSEELFRPSSASECEVVMVFI